MNLPNSHFQDFPIEFKEINPEDFPDFIIENNGEKVIIRPNEEGFINDELQANILLNDKNTVVVNAAVGQGKSFAIIKTIERYFKDEENEYLIFVASPFVSLVEQYYNEILEKTVIQEEDIYRYEDIGENVDVNYIGKKVQIITVNTLLGNPGEDAFVNSLAKRNYINDLINHCKVNEIRAVFIYDEIHDAIYNFKEKYIFNLWKWKEVVHKNIILSATYSEASKIVIEYLAELTDKRIKIIECTRLRRVSEQSNLFLHYDHSNNFSNTSGELMSIVSTIIKENKEIDILCYSKKLADEIVKNKEEGVGKLLFEKYGDNIHNCTSGLDNNERTERGIPNNRYKKDKCNVGTNFKTGVSIEKENHAFVIVMPPKSSKGVFKNYYGIFSNGINAVIQALARKRKKGDIYILLPKPNKFDYESLNFINEEQKSRYKYWYKIVENYYANESKKVKYYPLYKQIELLDGFYNDTLRSNVTESFDYIDSFNREGLVRLDFPEKKLFKMEDGEDYLANVFDFFGKDLSSYITYCSFTNQFVNCNLMGVNEKPAIFFKTSRTQWMLDDFFKNYFDEDWFWSLRQNVSDLYIYQEFKNEIFNHFTVIFSGEDRKWNVIKRNENKEFETQLLAFVQRKLYRNNTSFIANIEEGGFVKDSLYTRGEYFRSCISHSIIVDEDSCLLNDASKELVLAYKSLDYFRRKLIQSIQTTVVSRNEVRFIMNSFDENFIVEDDIDRFNLMIDILIQKDYFIINEFFDFKNSFIRTEDIESKKTSFYNYLKTDFLETRDKRINNSFVNANVKEILLVIPIPTSSEVMNFVQSGELLIPEENIPTMTLTQLQNLTNLGPENDVLSHSNTELQPDINMDILTGGIPEDSIPTFRLVDGKLIM